MKRILLKSHNCIDPNAEYEIHEGIEDDFGNVWDLVALNALKKFLFSVTFFKVKYENTVKTEYVFGRKTKDQIRELCKGRLCEVRFSDD